jgi:hypothetical protein
MKTHDDYIADALAEVMRTHPHVERHEAWNLVAEILAARCLVKDREIELLGRSLLNARQRIVQLEGLIRRDPAGD